MTIESFETRVAISMPLKIIMKFGFLLFFFGLISLSGCGSGSKNPEPVAEPPASSRPALKIWLVDAPELEKVISVRWQAASDQTLKIEQIPLDSVSTRDPFNADVVTYPGILLGDLVQKEAIGRLPAQAMAKREPDAEEPVRWRNIVTFGGQVYAVPLGASNLGTVMVGLDNSPLKELDSLLSSIRDLNAQSMEQWSLFLNQAESVLATSVADRRKSLADRLSKITPDEKAWLVDRFLFVASTTNARSRGLFDLVKMESRLNLPDFSNSAKVLFRIAQIFPETIAVDPTKAWDLAVSTTDAASFAVGWPNSVVGTVSDSIAELNGNLTVAPLTWNPNKGLIASVGKKTRQTAVSCQFLVWLSEPEQREALRAVCSGVELNVQQSDRNNERDDYRAFQTVNRRDSRVETMAISLRMANAVQYRAILADCLVAALREPDQIDSIFASCSEKWDQLTAKLGIETQRISEEQSLGYRK